MNFKRIIFFLGGLCVSFLTEAQNLSQHNWYFGNSANAIRFNRSNNKPAVVGGKFIPFGTGGSAVATDASNANLFFYTDGKNIYDGSNLLMDAANIPTNGAGLLGNNLANQPAVICPVPEDSTKYLVFANSANYTAGGTITVSVVDMTSFGNAASSAPPLGKVLKKNMATGLAGTSEGMIIIPHSNGKDYWLITHQNSSSTFTASQITKTSFNAGAGTFTFTSAGIATGLGVPMSVANFSYNSKLKKLAVSAQDTNTDAIILTFDDSTGALTFDRFIYSTGSPTVTTQSIYDIQWDNAGQYLYISRTGEAGINADVLQYDYVNSNPGVPTTILTSVLKNPEFRSWGLQLAPDSAIYHIYQTVSGGPFLIKKFTKTDTIASSVIETALPFGAIDFKGTQFPSFSPRARNILQLSFTPLTACQNNNTTFFPSALPSADSLHWNFGDTVATVSVTAWSPVHKYKTAGTFNVKLTAFYQGDSISITKSIVVNAFDLKLTLPSDTTACHPEFPTPYGTKTRFADSFKVTVRASGSTAGTVTYTWSDGETGKTLWPLKPGYYYVTTSADVNGCAAHAGVNVKEYELQDNRSNIWYFGNNAGIDFNSGAVALSGSNMNAPAGCAIVCDRNGQALFYTDGDQVYDKTKTSIASGIGGGIPPTSPQSSQSALIVPVPGDETLYYIFTTQPAQFGSNNELRYSLFDLKLNNGNGGIAPGQQGVLLFSKSTERITASTDWLIAHEWGNNTFRAYRITAGGLSDPVYSSIGSDHSFSYSNSAQGYMKLGPSPANTLAVALSPSAGINLLELFHLNDSTGVLSNYRKLTLSNTSGQAYGVEFSGTGSKVFATVYGTSSSNIYEYAIDTLGHTTLKRDTTFNVKVGALAMAPNGSIYVAIDGSSKLGIISPDEGITKKSSIDMGTGFALAGGTNSRMGLPNFIQHVNNSSGGPGFTWAGTCLGTPTVFTGTPTDPTIDTYVWTFGDGSGSTILSPTHLYGAANTYVVAFQINNRCLVEESKSPIVTKHSVKINAPPAPPSLTVPSPAICTAAVTLDANTPNTAGLTYLWSTGETTKTISVSTAMSVSVTNTDMNGCTSSASTTVADGRPQVNLGPDQTVCQNTAVPALDAKNAGDNFVWSIKDLTTSVVTPGGTIEFQGVNTTSPGRFMYSVVVTDPVTGCFANAATTFTVNQSPVFTMTGTNLTSCVSNDGKISLTGISSSHLYFYSITGPTAIPIVFDQNTATQGPFTGLAAGTYSGIISDQVSGCYAFKTVALSTNAFTVTPSAVNPQCDPPSIKITTSATGPWTYLITNTSTGATTPTTPPSPPFATSPQTVQLGSQGQGVTISYIVQVTDNAGCVVSANQSVTTKSTTPLNFNFDPCAGTVTETTGATSPSWSINGTPVTPPVLLTPGTNTYQLDALSNGCPVTLSSSYKFDGKIVPDFTFDQCIDQVTLTAAPIAVTYTYRWYENGSFLTFGQQASLGSAPYHKTVGLEIFDSNSGCTTPRTNHDVEIFGKVSSNVTSDAKCKDGTTFTVTASSVNAPSPTYQWYLNNKLISGATGATLPLQTSDGWYTVKTIQGTCSHKDSTSIARPSLPVGKLKQQYQICDALDNPDPTTKSADLDPGVFVSYVWYKDDVIEAGKTSEIYNATVKGKYKVYITDDIGCSNYDSTRVIINCEPVIAGPNAFRPASQHIENTYFNLITVFIDTFEVIVFNRWGEAVFESKDKDFHWNGGYNNNPGQPLPGGTYTYVVRYSSHYQPGEGVQELRGGVVLLR